MANSNELSVGYFPTTFPRDPIEVNIYMEHVLIGHAIEPLFTTGDDGELKGAAAESWNFSADHKEIDITLKKNLIFSNGKKLEAEDVKFSLDRHILNPRSQSHNYLKLIKKIEIINSLKIKIVLEKVYVPILKALSRDQLGILPRDWSFDKNSNRVLIEITDNGKGIPEEVLSKIGERGFSFGKENSLDKSGSGLGVYHAKMAIHKMGGSFVIESIQNIGTTIKIFLPTL